MDPNLSIQRLLYRWVPRYKLDIKGFINSISDIAYIAIKVRTPNTPNNFPDDYPIGKDLDLIIFREDASRIEQPVQRLAATQSAFDVRRVEKEIGFFTRFVFGGRLHYGIDIGWAVDGLPQTLVAESIEKRRSESGVYIPRTSYELVYRLNAFDRDPRKAHHLVFLKDNSSRIDWALLERHGLKERMEEILR